MFLVMHDQVGGLSWYPDWTILHAHTDITVLTLTTEWFKTESGGVYSFSIEAPSGISKEMA